MKKIFGLVIAVFAVHVMSAQTVTVQPVEREVAKVPRKGLGVNIELDSKFVEKQWKKKLKDFGGKSSSEKGGVTKIEGATITELSSSPVQMWTKVEGGKGTTEVWWIIDLGTEYVTSESSSFGTAKKILHDFGVECYREDINEQIEEAEKEYEKTVKNLEKEQKEGENLNGKIESNKSTIEKLQQENVGLEKEVDQNKKDQEQLTKDVATMKKKVEEVKAKLDKVR